MTAAVSPDSSALPASASAFPPRSAVRQLNVLVSTIIFAALVVLIKELNISDAVICLAVLVLGVASPHLLSLPPINPGAQSSEEIETQFRRDRLFVKAVGLAGIFCAVAILYFAFPVLYNKFNDDDFLRIKYFLFLGAMITPPYIWLTDRFMARPHDGLFHFGLLIIGPRDFVDRGAVKQYLLAWGVKAFFLPLMVSFSLDDIRWMINLDASKILSDRNEFYEAVYRLLYFVDVVIASTGYLFTCRLFRTHIRSTDSTFYGWAVCLMCYPPFWGFAYDNFAHYESGYFWGDWLKESVVIWWIWALAIFVMVSVYVWGTASFGIIFSNLTNRGIITNGPYRWLKHPCYVSKNISWWLIAIPFVNTTSISQTIQNCLALLIVNAIYYARAKTEERHLSQDEVYVAYDQWIGRYGLFAIIKSKFSIQRV